MTSPPPPPPPPPIFLPFPQENVSLRDGVVIRVSHLSMEDKQNRCQQFVHALTIAKVLMFTSVAEQDVQHRVSVVSVGRECVCA